jgi:hypothetical protein
MKVRLPPHELTEAFLPRCAMSGRSTSERPHNPF